METKLTEEDMKILQDAYLIDAISKRDAEVAALRAELERVTKERDYALASSERWYRGFKAARWEIGEARREAAKWYKRCLEVLQSTDTWPYDKMPLYCLTCGLTLGDNMICHRCGKDK